LKKEVKYFFYFVFLSVLIFPVNTAARVRPSVDKKGICFTENKGQWPHPYFYQCRLPQGMMFLEKTGIVWNLVETWKLAKLHLGKVTPQEVFPVRGHAFRMRFVGSDSSVQISSTDALSFYENYFLGNDPKYWKSGVLSYARVVYENLYPGIDWEILSNLQQIKYNFRIRKGHDYRSIQMEYEGVDEITVEKGELIIRTSVGDIKEKTPVAFQIIGGQRREIPCRFVVKGKKVSFELLTSVDPDYDIIIDPLLVFAAQSGSTADNFGMTATYDAAGNLYSGGMVYNVGYPTTTGAYSNAFNNPVGYGRTDLFITKYNAVGNALLYSTYIGGSGNEAICSIVVNQNNELCALAVTSSSNFPMLPNSAYPVFKGGSTIGYLYNGIIFCGGTDIVLFKFSPAGNALTGSTYFGGTNNDGVNNLTNTQLISIGPSAGGCADPFPTTGYDSLQLNYGDQFRGEIQVDKYNNIYITSSTRSSNLPIVGGFDNTHNGGQDALVAKFNSSLSSLIFSSYLGGSQNDCGNAIYIDPITANIYVAGGTCSSNFPVSNGLQTVYQGGMCDGYVVRISPSGASLVNGTFIGTNQYDNVFFVTGDKNGKIYVYGQSLGNMPVQAAPTATSVFSVSNTHQFIQMYYANLSSLYMSTVFGFKTNGVDISPSAFAVDKCMNIYLSGWGGGLVTNTVAMTNMPILNALPNHSTTTGYDFYLMALDSNATTLQFGSYFGGNLSEEHVDGGTSRFDPRGVIYQSVCAGCGGYDDFPVSPGAWPCGFITPCPPGPNLSTNCNNGVFKVDFQLNVAVASIAVNTLQGCAPMTVSFTNAVSSPTFVWYLGNGQTNSVNPNPVVTYTAPGTYTVSLAVINPTTCNKKDSTSIEITVLPSPSASFALNYTPCIQPASVVFNNQSSGPGPLSYTWNFGDGSPVSTQPNPVHTYTSNGIYTVQLVSTFTNGCSSVQSKTIHIFTVNHTARGDTVCAGKNATLQASGGTSYTWFPSGSFPGSNSSSPIWTNANASSVFTVQILSQSGTYQCVSQKTVWVEVYPTPSPDFTYTINPCGGGVQFTNLTTPTAAVMNWTLAPNVTSTLSNPYYFYSNGGTYTVILTAISDKGCPATTSKTLNVPTPPPVSVNAGSIICAGKTTAQLQASGGTQYLWYPSTGLSNSTIPNPVANPPNSTIYSVNITVPSGSLNCLFTLTTSVVVDILSSVTPSASASPTQIVSGNNSTLIYHGDPGANVTWYPAQFVSPLTGYTVQASPPVTTEFTVIVTKGVCTETLRVLVEVVPKGCEEGSSYVPNTFTPNGDGINDVLYVRGIKMESIYFAVYNRWGEKVFETKDKNIGWDGNYKGRPADNGVFGWYLKVKCYDGNEHVKKGNVTLIR